MTGSADTGTSGGITVASLETYHVSGSFAEADAASLAVGQPASVEFPAVPDAAAEGKVVWISPLGSSSNSVVTYEATVELDELPELIRLSQTATITVVTAEAANVLTLPSNAVSALSTTEGTVEVLADPTGASAETTTATVGLGLQGDSTIEITSGLEEGDAVLISMDTSTGLTSSETSGQFRMITGGAGGGGFPAGGGGFPGGGGGFPGGGMP
ncbi:MAG: HlyD family efflux transporter periplasmic adaptor subunit [Bifidobacteriaceae bacterium]|nr:HlyD family efflux transporter periplasmic adaptor subunit [Bifidobacteriaceae bacterium]